MVKVQVTGTGSFLALVLLFWWLAGLVMTVGFWSTLFGIICPPWAMYCVVERILQLTGFV